MLHEAAEGAAAESTALLAAYERLVRDAAAAAGRDRVASETPVDEGTAAALADDDGSADAAGLSVTDAAAILALDADRDADTILFELRDHLLMGMTTAVLDVDTLAGAIDADLTGQEVQQALEGRTEMTLAQLAEIQAVIEARKHT